MLDYMTMQQVLWAVCVAAMLLCVETRRVYTVIHLASHARRNV